MDSKPNRKTEKESEVRAERHLTITPEQWVVPTHLPVPKRGHWYLDFLLEQGAFVARFSTPCVPNVDWLPFVARQ